MRISTDPILKGPYWWCWLVGVDESLGTWGFTSMVKSSSILTAFPNMKMYCIRFENSHIFRSLSSRLTSVAGSEDSISSLPRLRDTILVRLLSCIVMFVLLRNSKGKNHEERVVLPPLELG